MAPRRGATDRGREAPKRTPFAKETDKADVCASCTRHEPEATDRGWECGPHTCADAQRTSEETNKSRVCARRERRAEGLGNVKL